ncbi:hypothetical protein Tco_0652421 [Tanacetum coccineum]|uniref:Eukaryotic translation initiation factor 3 subunit G N-terminal domain-containing protein n=1 Tax=Tanacetum coccineum TaxID=301880 RepID=A0ABQ4WXL6_9ASTR
MGWCLIGGGVVVVVGGGVVCGLGGWFGLVCARWCVGGWGKLCVCVGGVGVWGVVVVGVGGVVVVRKGRVVCVCGWEGGRVLRVGGVGGDVGGCGVGCGGVCVGELLMVGVGCCGSGWGGVMWWLERAVWCDGLGLCGGWYVWWLSSWGGVVVCVSGGGGLVVCGGCRGSELGVVCSGVVEVSVVLGVVVVEVSGGLWCDGGWVVGVGVGGFWACGVGVVCMVMVSGRGSGWGGRSTETSDGLGAIQAQLNNLRREIKKANEKVYAAQVGCEQCKGPHYTKDCPLKEEGKTLEEAYYTQFDAAIRNQGASIKTLEIQIGQISKVLQERGFGSLPSSTKTNPRDQVKSISTSIKADSNSIRRIGSNQYAVSIGHNSTPLYKARQLTVPFLSRLDNHYCKEEGNYGPKFTEACGASHINNAIPRKEKDLGSFTLPCFINDFCFDNALVDLGASVSVMPLSTYLNLGLGELVHTRLTVELADRTVKYPKGIAENILVGIGKFTFLVVFIILDMPEDIRVPLILRRPFLSTARAKIDVYKIKITLRVREEKIIFKSVKPNSSIIKRVDMLSLRERMELDLEARLMEKLWRLIDH